MIIRELIHRSGIEDNAKLKERYLKFENLLNELRKRGLSGEIVDSINKEIDAVNSIPDAGSQFSKAIKDKHYRIIQMLEKKLKLVPRGFYKNMWMGVGMAAFGIPIGIAFGSSLGNMSYLAMGIPLGMILGMAVGSGMDKKAQQEGRQLEVDA